MNVKEDVRKKVSGLKYGVIHSQIGFSDGVSIVIEQLENVMAENLKIPKSNIFYLVGKSAKENSRIKENELFWDKFKVNKFAVSHFSKGFGGRSSEKIESAISEAKREIENWVSQNKIDILFVHNSSHPVNFVYAVALSRYYRDSILKKKKTPKYILWWHDSHLERERFSTPSKDVEKYLLEGVPGRFVEHVVFINNLQFECAKNYFLGIDKRYKGFYKHILSNYSVAPNTTDTFIKSYASISKIGDGKLTRKFFKDFRVDALLKGNNLKKSDVIWCLQHTRILKRKRIDFALRFCYEVLQRSNKKVLYFLVSGQRTANDNTRRSLIALNEKLRKQYKKKVFLVFAEDFYDKTEISFSDYPLIFAKLGGFSTYFSEVEGFGNNLLEVMANGLIPVVHKYPVFKKDIEKFGFNLVALNEYDILEDPVSEVLKILKSSRERSAMVNHNLKILKKHFPHSVLERKLFEAILKERNHK